MCISKNAKTLKRDNWTNLIYYHTLITKCIKMYDLKTAGVRTFIPLVETDWQIIVLLI